MHGIFPLRIPLGNSFHKKNQKNNNNTKTRFLNSFPTLSLRSWNKFIGTTGSQLDLTHLHTGIPLKGNAGFLKESRGMSAENCSDCICTLIKYFLPLKGEANFCMP